MPDPTNSSNPHRLPRGVRPTRYDLVLEPDLDGGTFRGTVQITIEVDAAVDEVVLHAAELQIDSAEIISADGTRVALATALDESSERLSCTSEGGQSLLIPAGPATLSLAFRGTLNDKLRGFYRSRFLDTEGTERVLATTQFESTDARRAFPCWDEPDFKAVFGVTLVVPDGLMALSNGAESDRADNGDGRVRVNFVDTMVMSTYLVAFIVGPLEATDTVDVDGVPLRVVHPLGKAALAQFGLEIGASALRYYSSYYGIAYPGGKVDLVAIPDFAFGAMENLGCITFRETALLVDPASATQPELERVADVVAHELAHMWFGDLVTMKWWNGIWLNEAFATFMEVMAVDQFRPEWNRWSSFALGRTAAFDTDALAATRPIEYPVVSPADAEGMFDILTYEKGASVVRMLEQYLGAEPFRRGISEYLADHAYGNTETTDLWDALENATGEPVRRIADTWIFQGGHPVLTVTSGDANTILISQSIFRYLGAPDDATRWEVPIGIRWADIEGTIHRSDVLLSGKDVTVDLGAPALWVQVNRGAAGFYRCAYAPDLLAKLSAAALGSLDAAERYLLVDDTWASVLSGATTAGAFIELVSALGNETDVSVWRRIIGSLATLHRVASDADRPRLEGFIRSLLTPQTDRLGDVPRPGEPDAHTNLRASVFEALGLIGNDGTVKRRATALVTAALTSPGKVDPALGDAAVRVVAASADDATFDRFLAISKAATTPQDKLRYVGALADVDDPAVFSRFLGLLLSDEVRSQDAGFLLSRSLTNRPNAAAAWAFAATNWDTLTQRLPTNAISRMIAGVRTISDPSLAAQIRTFLTTHEVPQAAKAFSQHLERMQVTVGLAERERDRLADALA